MSSAFSSEKGRTEPHDTPEELSEEELRRERGAPLPDRESMSTIDADVAIPLNPALAADVLAGTEPSEEEGEAGVEDEGA